MKHGRPRGPHRIKIEGRLEAYAADPARGVLWSIHEDGRPGQEGVHPLLNGNFLTVYGEEGTILWSGIVDLDFELLQVPDFQDPTKMKQQVLGRWVHGAQKYEDPEVWAQMFFGRRRALMKRFRIPATKGVRW